MLRALLRSSPSLAPVPHRALLAVSGSDATQFLNGLLANTVQGNPSYSAFLHAQVRIFMTRSYARLSLVNRAASSTTSSSSPSLRPLHPPISSTTTLLHPNHHPFPPCSNVSSFVPRSAFATSHKNGTYGPHGATVPKPNTNPGTGQPAAPSSPSGVTNPPHGVPNTASSSTVVHPVWVADCSSAKETYVRSVARHSPFSPAHTPVAA